MEEGQSCRVREISLPLKTVASSIVCMKFEQCRLSRNFRLRFPAPGNATFLWEREF